jgi:hypothetical protein
VDGRLTVGVDDHQLRILWTAPPWVFWQADSRPRTNLNCVRSPWVALLILETLFSPTN